MGNIEYIHLCINKRILFTFSCIFKKNIYKNEKYGIKMLDYTKGEVYNVIRD